MHGIVYVDKHLKHLALYTWQDKRGDEVYNKNYSFSEYVYVHTGFQVPTEYGLLTHYYNLQKINTLQEKRREYAPLLVYS